MAFKQSGRHCTFGPVVNRWLEIIFGGKRVKVDIKTKIQYDLSRAFKRPASIMRVLNTTRTRDYKGGKYTAF